MAYEQDYPVHWSLVDRNLAAQEPQRFEGGEVKRLSKTKVSFLPLQRSITGSELRTDCARV